MWLKWLFWIGRKEATRDDYQDAQVRKCRKATTLYIFTFLIEPQGCYLITLLVVGLPSSHKAKNGGRRLLGSPPWCLAYGVT